MARANGYALHGAGGTELLVDLASVVHEASDPSTAAPASAAGRPAAASSSRGLGDGQAVAAGAGMPVGGTSVMEVSGMDVPGAAHDAAAPCENSSGAPGVQPQLLAAQPHAEEEEGGVREWYCYLPPNLVADAPVAVAGGGATSDAGAGASGGA